jgi:multiple sugar transport system substrate-binding protein
VSAARSRRDFLRLAAGAAAGAFGAACGSGSDKTSGTTAAKAKGNARKGERTLRIAQWSHFVPAYDAWFDNEFTKRWGEEHGVEVLVDHIPFPELRSRVEAELAAGRRHDVFAFLVPPAGLEDDVIDHREIVEEVAAKVGPLTPLVERSIRNPKTGRYFAFPDFWGPQVTHYRSDLWDGLDRETWDGLLRAAPRLKAAGHPLGLGFSPDHDSTMGLVALMFAHGSTLQDDKGAVAINSQATVEAVKRGAVLFAGGLTAEVLVWDGASDNRLLASGKASLILDPISAMRATEQQDAALARQIGLAPTPAGAVARIGPHSLLNTYVIMKSSPNREMAGRFLVDLAVGYREAFIRSEFYNVPAFPGAVPDMDELLAADPALPAGKYATLATAAEWSTNLGHPGHDNAAVEEVFNLFLIPKMFAAAATGGMSAEEAVKAAEAEIAPIYQKWREQGKM